MLFVGALSAAFFSWVQGAGFYAGAHRDAVLLLPEGVGRTWLDVGCGPGLVSRLACERGYDSLGVDLDPHMVRAARRRSTSERCRYQVAGLDVLPSRGAWDVVSAASLLFVLPDARQGLEKLWACVHPGGSLLVVETTSDMTPQRAREIRKRVAPGRRIALTLWAHARGGRAVDPGVFLGVPAASMERHLLLEGLLQASVLAKGSR